MSALLSRWILVVVLLVSQVTIGLLYAADPWKDAVRLVRTGLVRLERPVSIQEVHALHHPNIFKFGDVLRAICTGFTIDAVREYVLTAQHCNGDKLTVDGKKAFVVWEHEAEDLMVLRVEKLERAALHASKKTLSTGLPLAALGYGYGLSEPLLRVGHIASSAQALPGLTGDWLIASISYIGGMSGGPVFDDQGAIIGIVQMSDPYVGIGRRIDRVLKVTSDYWAHE